MGKGKKILLYISAGLVSALIILPLSLSLVLRIPAVQTAVAQWAVGRMGRSLGTTVSVDGIYFRFFNRLEIEGLYVEDLAGDTLLWAGRLSADINSMGLRKGHMRLGSVEIDDALVGLAATDSAGMNAAFIFERLSLRQGKASGPFRMDISSLALDNVRVKVRGAVPRAGEYGIDFSDLDISSLRLRGSDLRVNGDTVSAAIGDLAFSDKSGFRLSSLGAGHLAVSPSGVFFTALDLQTPDSRLHFDRLGMGTEGYGAFSDLFDSVDFDISLSNSTLGLGTLSYFVPSLRGMDLRLHDLSANMEGPLSNLSGLVSSVRMGGSRADVGFLLTGLPVRDNTRFVLEVRDLATNHDDIAYIVRDISGGSIPEGLGEAVARLGDISVTGHFDGYFSNFIADAALGTSLGAARVNLNFASRDRGRSFSGRVSSEGMDMGTLLGHEKIGSVSMDAQVDGAIRSGAFRIDTDARLSRLTYNGYDYSGVDMKGLIDNRTFRGHITCEDRNLSFDFDGLLDFTTVVPVYDFNMALRRADLRALNFNRRDEVSVLSCNVHAAATGTTIDDLNGRLEIDDLVYVNHVDSVATGRISVTGRNSERSKMLQLSSSFADAEFRSRMSYKMVSRYLGHTLRRYLPLPGSEDARDIGAGEAGGPDNFTILRLSVKEGSNVAGIFLPGLRLARGTNLSLMLNPNADQLSFSFGSDYVEGGSFLATNIDVNSRNQGDSLTFFMKSEDFYVPGFHMPNLSLVGGSRGGRVDMSTRFSDPETDTRALFGATSILDTDPRTGMRRVSVSLSPSTYVNRGQTWRIMARNIVYDTARVEVNGFRVVSEGQELALDGAVSRSSGDTLKVRLSNFDLAPISRFSARAGYDIEGYATGYADLISLMDNGMFHADISFDSVRVNDIPVAPARFESEWDFGAERARFALIDRNRADTVARGFYRPTDGRYRVDAQLDNMAMAWIDPLVRGAIRDSEGTCDASLMLTGGRGEVRLNGTADVKDYAVTVDYTNVRYNIRQGRMAINDNQFSMQGAEVRDGEGNKGTLDINLNNNNFRNFGYDIRVRPENMLVLNTTSRNNDYFYGSVYASGMGSIRGGRSGTDIDVVATTGENSTFFLPLSGKTDLSQADFVVFESPAVQRTDTAGVHLRKSMIFERGRAQREMRRGDMNLNMAINVRPNTDLQLVIDPTVGDIIRSRGTGSVNLHVNPRSNEFTMYGDYEISEGSYLLTLQNIINKRFVIEPGSTIKWTGEPVDALLDITAVYRLKASLAPLAPMMGSVGNNLQRTVPVDCEIKFGDRLSRPSIDFDVQVQNVDPEIRTLLSNVLNSQEMKATQFVWLLAVNSFYVDTGAGINLGALGGSATGFDFLSNQLSNWLSSDRYNFGFRYRPKTDITSDELDFGFTTDIVDDRLQLEVEGNYNFDNNETLNRNTNNLTGDFYLTWKMDRSGNVRAKGFRRTIDRFDENQGLQESGMGLYFREDFDSFSDIGRNIRQRREQRREQRARRKAGETADEDQGGVGKPYR